jgi:hypothetical protein
MFLLFCGRNVHPQTVNLLASGDKPLVDLYTSRFDFSAQPCIDLPLGDSSNYYTLGAGFDLAGSWILMQPLGLRASLGYGYSPLQTAEVLNRLMATTGLGLTIPLAPRLALSAYAEAGYGIGVVQTGGQAEYGGSLASLIGAELGFSISPRIELGLAVKARRIFGLYDGLGLSLAASYQFGGEALNLARYLDSVDMQRQGPIKQAAFRASPGIELPIGDSRAYYDIGAGMDLSGSYALLLPLVLRGSLGYAYSPLHAAEGLNRFSATAGLGLTFPVHPRLVLTAFSEAGYGVGVLNAAGQTESGSSLAGLLGAEFGFLINPSLELGLVIRGRRIFGLYDGLGVSLGASYQFGAQPAHVAALFKPLDPVQAGSFRASTAGGLPALHVGDAVFDTVFPVLFKHYENHPIGSLAIENTGKVKAENVRVTLFVHNYMDVPRDSVLPFTLEAGEQRKVDLKALFNERMLDVTEATMVTAEVAVEFNVGKSNYVDRRPFSLRMWDRNAITWDDDRKVAAFVTAKDPVLLSMTRTVSGIATNQGSRSVSEQFRKAMAMYYAVIQAGVSYVVDPRTPYAQLSALRTSVDFLQFPRQTLEYRGGDCDDLTTLYCAMLESVGVDTAFITVPGHIYPAFSLGVPATEARKHSRRIEDLLILEDEVWVPVEITALKDGFLKAWELGAKQWREHAGLGQARLYKVHDAWKIYEPVGLPGSPLSVPQLNPEQLATIFLGELVRHIDREIQEQVVQIQAEIRRTGNDPRQINRLGVLYASFGLYEKAMAEFDRVLQRQEYTPVLVNLGNIHFLQRNYDLALQYYERAARREPEHPGVLLSMARVSHELENYGLVRKTFGRLKELDPRLAEQYAYLDLRGDEAGRAAAVAGVHDTVRWEE